MPNLDDGLDDVRYGNLQKYLNPNPIQRWLLQRFYRHIVASVRTTRARRILDVGCGEGFTVRIHAYKNHGYFPPEEADALIVAVNQADTPYAREILRRFVERYRSGD